VPNSPPRPTTSATGRTFSASALLDAVAAIAAAGSRHDIASVVSATLAELDGVRASAVLQRHGDHAVVIGCSGYGCDTMAPGSALPLDSGLPAARAIKTGQAVLQGDGPGWCAFPFGHRASARGAVLLSLTGSPPSDAAELARLQRLTAAVGAALERAEQTDRTAAELTAVLAGLAPAAVVDEDATAVRQSARGGALGGDVALCLTDADGRWLIVADVSGAGLAAASRAAAVRIATRALLPAATGPAHLLELLDRTLRPETPEGGFVTAVVVHVADGTLRAASAGHHAPVLLNGGVPDVLGVEPGPPLALETTDRLRPPRELVAPVPAEALVVLYSDGLTDRRTTHGRELDINELLVAAAHLATTAEIADALLAAADDAGPADDDTTVLVSRL
jgi:hypothetical protein